MHRFYLAPAAGQSDDLILSGSEAHHAIHVLRVRAQERVMVLDGQGVERVCAVRQTNRDTVILECQERREIPAPAYQLTLLQALPKGKLFESIVQKATELGAAEIVPLLSERVIVRLEKRDLPDKAAKWQAVAIEAIKQCGSAWLPKVNPPQTIQEFLGRGTQYDLALVGALQGPAHHPRKYLREFEEAHGRRPRTVGVWIGPEGDFTPAELGLIQEAGALPISLGPLVLRTETAATYALSFLNYELQAPPGR